MHFSFSICKRSMFNTYMNYHMGGTMISAGIVVEYNPFHNGHLYHLHQTRKQTTADVVIAVMSGHFLQRGEPALVSKFARTKMALQAGVDLVVELPYAFSTQKAEIFAHGAISILSSLQTNFICFGSESGSLTPFYNTLHFIEDHKHQYNDAIKKFMNDGLSYPKAASLAFRSIAKEEPLLDLSKPNNILGYHYIKALHRLKSSTLPITIKRVNAEYHEPYLSTSTQISSATSIRNIVLQNDSLTEIRSHVPYTSYEGLLHYKHIYGNFVQWENLWPYLKYKLLHSEPEELKEIYEVEEGIEHRLIRYCRVAISFSDFMEKVKTKRYTWTRLQRVCVHILTNTKKEEMKKRCNHPEYIRVLGFNEKGRKYLKEKKHKCSLPIISKLSQIDQSAIRLDVKASHIYSLAFNNQISKQIIKEEASCPPIIV